MIQGFNEDIAGELLNRAIEFSEAEAKRITEELEKLNVQDDLRDAEYLSLAMILTLAENKILCLDDLAELDSEELLELLGELISRMKPQPVTLSWPRAHTGSQMKTLKLKKQPQRILAMMRNATIEASRQ